MKFPFTFSRKNKNQKLRTSRMRCRSRPRIEILEARVLLANTSLLTQPTSLATGTVFRDLNASGLLDAGEPGLANRQVFVDANNNGQLDPFETSTTTDANGAYTLDLAPGEYTIRVVPGLNETLTFPTGGSYDVTVTA